VPCFAAGQGATADAYHRNLVPAMPHTGLILSCFISVTSPEVREMKGNVVRHLPRYHDRCARQLQFELENNRDLCGVPLLHP
jgi:hypothetical protein